MLLSDLLIELQDATYAQADELAKLDTRFRTAQRGEHGREIRSNNLHDIVSELRGEAGRMDADVGAALRKERNAH